MVLSTINSLCISYPLLFQKFSQILLHILGGRKEIFSITLKWNSLKSYFNWCKQVKLWLENTIMCLSWSQRFAQVINGNYNKNLIEKDNFSSTFITFQPVSVQAPEAPLKKTLAGKGNQRKVCCKHPCSQNQFMFNNSICTIFSCPEGWGVRRGGRKRKQAKKFTYLYPWGKKLNFVGTSEWIAKIHWWRKKEEVGETAWVLEMGCFRKRRKTEMEVKLEELCFMKGVSWDRDIAGNYICLCNPVV